MGLANWENSSLSLSVLGVLQHEFIKRPLTLLCCDQIETEFFKNVYRGSIPNLNSGHDTGQLHLLPSKFDKCTRSFTRQSLTPIFARNIKRQRGFAGDDASTLSEVRVETAAAHILFCRL